MRLFVDLDGTVTVEDSLVQVIHAFGDPSILAELEPRVGVDLTLHEEIAAEFAAVGAPLADVVDWVLEVLANRVEASKEGWRVSFRDEAACARCGEPCKRAGVAGAPYTYVGDGYSDRCAALGADRVFARDSLARHLEKLGVAYEPFDDLAEVATLLRG